MRRGNQITDMALSSLAILAVAAWVNQHMLVENLEKPGI